MVSDCVVFDYRDTRSLQVCQRFSDCSSAVTLSPLLLARVRVRGSLAPVHSYLPFSSELCRPSFFSSRSDICFSETFLGLHVSRLVPRDSLFRCCWFARSFYPLFTFRALCRDLRSILTQPRCFLVCRAASRALRYEKKKKREQHRKNTS